MQTVLHKAVIENDLYLLKQLLMDTKNLALINEVDNEGFTALQLAVRKGNCLDIVKILLMHNADPNIPDKAYYAPIFTAIYLDDFDALRALVSYKADLTITDRIWHHTPLLTAILNKKLTAVQILLPYSDINDYKPLHVAAAFSNSAIILALLKKFDIEIRNTDSTASMDMAVMRSDLMQIEHMASATPLHMAVMVGNLEAVETLLSSGAAVDALNKMGSQPLHLTLPIKGFREREEELSIDMIKALLAAKVNINAQDLDGYTLLHMTVAMGMGLNRIIKFLLDNGADVNLANKEGDTPFHAAADRESPNEETIKLLWEAGANHLVPNKKGETAFKILVQQALTWLEKSRQAEIDRIGLAITRYNEEDAEFLEDREELSLSGKSAATLEREFLQRILKSALTWDKEPPEAIKSDLTQLTNTVWSIKRLPVPISRVLFQMLIGVSHENRQLLDKQMRSQLKKKPPTESSKLVPEVAVEAASAAIAKEIIEETTQELIKNTLGELIEQSKEQVQVGEDDDWEIMLPEENKNLLTFSMREGCQPMASVARQEDCHPAAAPVGMRDGYQPTALGVMKDNYQPAAPVIKGLKYEKGHFTPANSLMNPVQPNPVIKKRL